MDVLERIEQLRRDIAAIDAEVAPHWAALAPAPGTLSIRDMKRAMIIQAIAVAKSNQEAAGLLGISRTALELWVKKMNLTPAYGRRRRSLRKDQNGNGHPESEVGK